MPGATDEFTKRLQQALGQAGSKAPGTRTSSTATSTPASTTSGADEYSARLAGALSVSSGQMPPQQTGEVPAAAEPSEVPEDTGPVGTGEHVVRKGESISSIAFETGHFGETIWNDPGNSELRAARESPEILLPGDRVHVPELTRKDEAGQTEARHRFRRKGSPEKLRLQLQAYDEPRANTAYTLEVGSRFTSGETDGDGWLEEWLPNNARWATLRIGEQEEYRLHVGSLAPITEMDGVVDRLINLGFIQDIKPSDEEIAEGLSDFQSHYDLPVTGEADQPTRDRLVEEHGS